MGTDNMSYVLKKEDIFQYVEEGEGPISLAHHMGFFGALSNWNTVLDHFYIRL